MRSKYHKASLVRRRSEFQYIEALGKAAVLEVGDEGGTKEGLKKAKNDGDDESDESEDGRQQAREGYALPFVS